MANIPRNNPLRDQQRGARLPTRGIRIEKIIEGQTDADSIRGTDVESFAGAQEGSVVTYKDGVLKPLPVTAAPVGDHDLDSHLRALKVTVSSGLDIAYASGRARIDQTVYDITAGTLTMSDDATNYVFVNSSGVVTSNTSSFPANSIPMALVITSGGAITSISDRRCFFYEDTAAGGGGAHNVLDGGTTHTDAATGTPAKGAIIAGSGTAWDDLGVGANDQVLTADSAQALGMKWAAAPGVTDHGALTGLADDDHPQYAALGQTETVTGAWAFQGSVDFAGFMEISARWTITGIITPPQITADQNNYNPTTWSTGKEKNTLRLSSDATRTITGLVSTVGGKTALIFNVGSFDIVFADESASSTAGNRFAFSGENITLSSDHAMVLWYDSLTSRWRCLAVYRAGGGGGDPDAIHDNVAGEIAAVTEKTVPARGDLVLIEDSAAANAKKRMTIGNLPSGGPTFVIAASAASAIVKAGADYVCDGTADQTEINQAITDLPAGGGRIVLSEGTFTIDNKIVINKHGVTIEGGGVGARSNASTGSTSGTRIEAAGTFPAATPMLDTTQATAAKINKGIVLTNFVVDGKAVAGSIHGILLRTRASRIMNVHVHRCSGDGILFESNTENCIDNVVSHCEVSNCTGAGIRWLSTGGGNSADNHVLHCIVYDNGFGLRVDGGSQQITSCHFYGPQINGIWFEGSGSRTKVIGCKLENSTQHNVFCDGSASAISEIVISGCTFRHSAGNLAADNTYDEINVSGANSITRGVIVGCSFDTTETVNRPRYAVNISASTHQNWVVGPNNYDVGSTTYGTGPVNAAGTGTVIIPSAGYPSGADSTKFWRGDNTWAVPSGSGHTIRENGANQPARANLNFIDPDSDIIVDDAGNDETEVRLQNYLLRDVGRPGGQSLYGGSAANENLIVGGTSHATHATSIVSVLDHMRLASGKVIQDSGGNQRVKFAPSGEFDIELSGGTNLKGSYGHVIGTWAVGVSDQTTHTRIRNSGKFGGDTLEAYWLNIDGDMGDGDVNMQANAQMVIAYFHSTFNSALAVPPAPPKDLIGIGLDVKPGIQRGEYTEVTAGNFGVGRIGGAEVATVTNITNISSGGVGILATNLTATNFHQLWLRHIGAVGNATNIYGIRMQHPPQGTNCYGLHIEAMTVGTLRYPLYIDSPASTSDDHGSVHRGNFQFGSLTRSFGAGDGMIGIANATTAPTSNPTGGGVLYSVSGGLRWRGASGVETLISDLNSQWVDLTDGGSTTLHSHALPAHGPSAHTEGTAWRMTYQNASGDETEFILGASGTVLMSQGASAAPVFTSLQSSHHYLFMPDAAPGVDVVAGDQQGAIHHSGPSGDTATRLYVDCETAAGTSVVVTVQYGDTDDLDTVTAWTTIATATATGKTFIQNTMTNASIPADRLVRLNIGTITGSAPKDMTVTLRTKRVFVT